MIEPARSLTILAAAPRPRFSPGGDSIGSPFSHATRVAARSGPKRSAYLCSAHAGGPREDGAPAAARGDRCPQVGRHAARAGEGARSRRLPGDAGDDLPGHSRARPREDARCAWTAALRAARPGPTEASGSPGGARLGADAVRSPHDVRPEPRRRAFGAWLRARHRA